MICRIQVVCLPNFRSCHLSHLSLLLNRRTDYYVGSAANWMMDHYIDETKEQIQSAIGVDITSATDREEFACAVYSMFSNTSIQLGFTRKKPHTFGMIKDVPVLGVG